VRGSEALNCFTRKAIRRLGAAHQRQPINRHHQTKTKTERNTVMANNAKASIKGKTLIIELPLDNVRPSSSGKTLLVATTSGATDATINIPNVGTRVIHFTGNAFVYPQQKAA
jgi:hypothetical protein